MVSVYSCIIIKLRHHGCVHAAIHNNIIESVDSISRDGPDTPIIINVIQNKKPKYSVQIHFKL